VAKLINPKSGNLPHGFVAGETAYFKERIDISLKLTLSSDVDDMRAKSDERQIEFVEESEPAARDALSRRYCRRVGGGLRRISAGSEEDLRAARGTPQLGRK
jgi:hypothetical protein